MYIREVWDGKKYEWFIVQGNHLNCKLVNTLKDEIKIGQLFYFYRHTYKVSKIENELDTDVTRYHLSNISNEAIYLEVDISCSSLADESSLYNSNS